MQPYEILEHTGDFKIRARGKNLAELFTHAAQAMMEFIYGKEVYSCFADKTEKVVITATDKESLLVDWLSELLYLSDSNNRAYTQYEITAINETHVEVKAGSCEAKAEDDIKAVTYNELAIEKKRDGWEAVVVFDI